MSAVSELCHLDQINPASGKSELREAESPVPGEYVMIELPGGQSFLLPSDTIESFGQRLLTSRLDPNRLLDDLTAFAEDNGISLYPFYRMLQAASPGLPSEGSANHDDNQAPLRDYRLDGYLPSEVAIRRAVRFADLNLNDTDAPQEIRQFPDTQELLDQLTEALMANIGSIPSLRAVIPGLKELRAILAQLDKAYGLEKILIEATTGRPAHLDNGETSEAVLLRDHYHELGRWQAGCIVAAAIGLALIGLWLASSNEVDRTTEDLFWFNCQRRVIFYGEKLDCGPQPSAIERSNRDMYRGTGSDSSDSNSSSQPVQPPPGACHDQGYLDSDHVFHPQDNWIPDGGTDSDTGAACKGGVFDYSQSAPK